MRDVRVPASAVRAVSCVRTEVELLRVVVEDRAAAEAVAQVSFIQDDVIDCQCGPGAETQLHLHTELN